MSSREEMPASSHFKEFLRKLNEHQVRYLIVGAYAVMKYTEPRYTKDLDVWVEASPDNLVSREDLLISKTAAGRPQDLIDAERLRLSDEI